MAKFSMTKQKFINQWLRHFAQDINKNQYEKYVKEKIILAVLFADSLSVVVNFFVGLSIGVNVLVSNYYGAKQERHLSETVPTAMAISIVSGVVLVKVFWREFYLMTSLYLLRI